MFGEPGVGMATVALTMVILVFCEIMPKSIAVVHATPIARMVIPPISTLAGEKLIASTGVFTLSGNTQKTGVEY